MPGFKIEWIRDGKVVSEEMTYTFSESEPGTYPIIIKAWNEDGETSKEFEVEVVETLPYKVFSLPHLTSSQPLTEIR